MAGNARQSAALLETPEEPSTPTRAEDLQVHADSLYRIKPWFVDRLDGVRRVLIVRGVSADAVSLAALPVIALTTGLLIAGSRWQLLWLAVGPLCLVWMALNALDGSMARATGTSTRRGAAINELIDRAGDAALLVAALVLVPDWIAFAASGAVAAMECVGLIGWATAGTRNLHGVMGKPDRAFTVSVGAMMAAVFGSLILSLAYLVVAAGATVGAVQRVRSTLQRAQRMDDGDVDIS